MAAKRAVKAGNLPEQLPNCNGGYWPGGGSGMEGETAQEELAELGGQLVACDNKPLNSLCLAF